MTTEQWQDALAQLGITQAKLAQLLGREPRSVRRWIVGEHKTPLVVEILMRGLTNGKISLEDLE